MEEILPQKMDVKMRKAGELVALSCPSCGAPVTYGQGGCGHCGSGLMRKEGKGSQGVLIPNDAKEWKKGVDFKPDEALDQILAKMEAARKSKEYLYVVWKGIPALVGEGINAEQALKNYHESSKQYERENLGSKWTDAVAQFQGFLAQIESMPANERQRAGEEYFNRFGENARIRIEARQFFTTPSFESFEEIMTYLPENNDADKLVRGINEIKPFIGDKS
jgi:hypothetical protein